MKFFYPEDFDDRGTAFRLSPEECAERANAKLERDGKVVYGDFGRSHTLVPSGQGWWTIDDKTGRNTHKALLIAIEPIEKCSHRDAVYVPPDSASVPSGWFCKSCRAKVKPKEFEEITG